MQLPPNLSSHPGSIAKETPARSLADHSKSVTSRAIWSLSGECIDPTISPDNATHRALWLCCWFHDAGKALPPFQWYLAHSATVSSEPPESGDNEQWSTEQHARYKEGQKAKEKLDELTKQTGESIRYHARFGALLAYHALRVSGYERRDALAGFLAVARHHGVTPSAARYTLDVVTAERAVIESLQGPEYSPNWKDAWCWIQVQGLVTSDSWRTARKYLTTLIDGVTDGATSLDAFVAAVLGNAAPTGPEHYDLPYQVTDKTVSPLLEDLRSTVVPPNSVREDAEFIPSQTYDRFLRFWSALTMADTTDVAGIEHGRLLAKHLPRKNIAEQIDKLGGNAANEFERRLNTAREDARTQVTTTGAQRLLNALDQAPHGIVGELTLPTGLGKTLTSLELATILRDELADDGPGEKPRIIYGLPFTAIIEQTRDLLERDPTATSPGFGLDPFGRTFTPHSHLNETVMFPASVQTNTDEPLDALDYEPVENDYTLAEMWRSGLTLTTFVQLFESLVKPSKAQGRKLPALTNSIIILDEPQSVPYRWWAGIRRLVELLVTEYNVTIIAMTATQPHLFDDSDLIDPVPLIDDQHRYFEAGQRVTYSFDDSVWDYGSDNPAAKLEAPVLSYDEAGHRTAITATRGDPPNMISNAADHCSNDTNSISVLAVCNTVSSARILRDETVRALFDHPAIDSIVDIGRLYDEWLTDDDGIESAREFYQANVSESDADTTLFDGRPDQTTWSDTRDVPVEIVVEYLLSVLDERDPDALVGMLTARHRPADRQVLTMLADRLSTGSRPFVLSTTQVIEAGVDISFGVVYRDLAPLEHIVQAAGRCNRSFEWGEAGGTVIVWRLASPPEGYPIPDPVVRHPPDIDTPVWAGDGSEKTPGELIYETDETGSLLRLVATHLREEIENAGANRYAVPDYIVADSAISRYYETISDHIVGDPDIPRAIDECDGETLRTFSFIPDEYETQDFLVARTPRERRRIAALPDLWRQGNKGDVFDALSEFADCRVSIPMNETVREAVDGLQRIDGESPEESSGIDIRCLLTEADGQRSSYTTVYGVRFDSC